MKLVWSPETALESYLDTIKSCDRLRQSGEAEFIAATAGGWNAKLIVEAWAPCAPAAAATSVGLSIAARHTGGRHVCVVPNQLSKARYAASTHGFGLPAAPEVLVGEAEAVLSGLEGVDFLVVDGRRRDLVRVVRSVKVSQRGAVLVCRNVRERRVEGFRWDWVVGDGVRVVRSVVLPVERGLDIAYVGHGGGGTGRSKVKRSERRWVKHIDEGSGEEHLFRRRR
uniref:Uncharacterized protein n=1 Tax=Kalanchoe fedtschenkoi TaxID=63787 RepID=A0A7N0TCL0_KALFE